MASFIFQGNPKVFRIDEYLESREELRWTARRHRNHMSVGDTAYVWRSDGGRPRSGGVVAKGTIVSGPAEMPDDAPELWKDGRGDALEWRVRIKLDEVRLTRLDGMLVRRDLMRDDILGGMLILRFAQGTSYRLEPAEALRMQLLWDRGRNSAQSHSRT